MYVTVCCILNSLMIIMLPGLFRVCGKCLTTCIIFFFFTDTATTEIYTSRHTLSLPDALPISGERAASGSIFTDEYFTYSGIDANGIPTGLTPVGGADGGPAPGPVSANNEVGIAPDPQTVTSTNLKPQYQDEFILGFDKSWGPDWVYGAKATYRTVGTVIDDECDADRVKTKMEALGYKTDNYLWATPFRSEEQKSELQLLMRN